MPLSTSLAYQDVLVIKTTKRYKILVRFGSNGAMKNFRSVSPTLSVKNSTAFKEGNPCETVVIQASPILEYLQKEEFIDILWEVAEIADILEEKHFGGDSN